MSLPCSLEPFFYFLSVLVPICTSIMIFCKPSSRTHTYFIALFYIHATQSQAHTNKQHTLVNSILAMLFANKGDFAKKAVSRLFALLLLGAMSASWKRLDTFYLIVVLDFTMDLVPSLILLIFFLYSSNEMFNVATIYYCRLYAYCICITLKLFTGV